jgi:hypothetical protein
MLIASNGDGDAFVGKHLYFIFWPVRDGNAVLAELVDDHLHNFVDMPHGFLAGVSPRGGAVLLQGGTISVPPVGIGFCNYFEGVGLHVHYYGAVSMPAFSVRISGGAVKP